MFVCVLSPGSYQDLNKCLIRNSATVLQCYSVVAIKSRAGGGGSPLGSSYPFKLAGAGRREGGVSKSQLVSLFLAWNVRSSDAI